MMMTKKVMRKVMKDMMKKMMKMMTMRKKVSSQSFPPYLAPGVLGRVSSDSFTNFISWVIVKR